MARLLTILRRAELLVAVCVLGVIVAVVFAGTIGRYAGRPVLWSDEVAQALFPWLVFLAADVTLQRNGHFRIDFAVAPLPAWMRATLDLVIKLVLVVLLTLLVHFGTKLVGISKFRPLPMTGISTAWAAAALPVGFALMLLTMAEQAVALIRGRLARDEAARDVM